jgi:hypothetical protein
MIDESEPKNTLLDNTILLALATLGSYFLIYSSYWARANVYKYPLAFIELNISAGYNLSKVAILLSLFVMLYWFILTKFSRSHGVYGSAYVLLLIFIALSAQLTLITIAPNVTINFHLLYLIVAASFSILVVILSLIFPSKIKSLILKTPLFYDDKYFRTKNYLIIIIAFFNISSILYIAATQAAKNNNEFSVLTINKEQYAILEVFPNTFILAAIENNKRTNSLVIYRADSGQIIPVERKVLNH